MEHVLTDKECERYRIIKSCIDGHSTNKETALKLGLKVRQVQLLKRAVEKNGEHGVVHGNVGKVSNRATAAATKKAVIAFFKKPLHQDFGPTFAHEQLAKENVVLSEETLRSIMIQENIWKPRIRRNAGIHRQWRERMGMYGELVQFDGSYHNWLEGRGGSDEECLLSAIDDATSTAPYEIFEDNEGVRAVFRFWWTYIETHGRPVAIYLDKFSTYKVNHKSAVDNDELMTQFKRAMTELDIKVINANSPEAKGRIERHFGTLQDRLVKEMRLVGINTRDAANDYLLATYISDHNARFGVVARIPGDAHRPRTKEQHAQLPSIFSIQSTRRVNNDYTIQFKNSWYQLDATQGTTVFKGDAVTIEERLDDSVHIRLKETFLTYAKLPERPPKVKIKVTALTREKPRCIPPANHPWRRRK